ncbi:MAG: hypothetical protein ABSF70_07560 [Terracidiphilus sp.]
MKVKVPSMVVPCGTSARELREAFFLNLNAAAFLRLTFSNGRLLALLCVALFVIVEQIVKGKGDLRIVLVMAMPVALILGFMWLRLTNSLGRTAKALTASGARMSIEAQGITTVLANGSRTFEPWSAFTRWREGELVFTVGNTKNYRTISKSALGMYADELRSLLLSQVHTAVH